MRAIVTTLRHIPFLLLLAFLLVVSVEPASAGGDIYPTELYSGINPIGLSDSDGIAKIEIRVSGDWRPLRRGLGTSLWRVHSLTSFSRCAKKAGFALRVDRIDRNFSVQIRTTNCDGDRKTYRLSLTNTWNLFHEDFGRITTADRPCHTFTVQAVGGDFTIDRIESPSSDFKISYPFRKPPIKIRGTRTYRYTVCYTPSRIGRVKVPIYVHIRREQPVGKYRTYIVADTAYVRVVRSSRPTIDPPDDPIQQPIYVPPPKPPAPRPPSVRPSPPPEIPAGGTLAMPREVDEIVPDSLDPRRENPDGLVALGELPAPEPPIFDPTTFRRVLSPSARSLQKGDGFIGSYGLAGLLAGYAPIDRLTVIGGGAWVPPSIAEFSALSIGAKYTVVDDPDYRLAAGLQANRTTTSASAVTSVAPFVTGEIGTLDYGLGATVGYSWRRHLPSDTTITPFERQALLLGIGGEYRFARHWKVVGEAFWIDGTEFEPLGLTLRWFNNDLAIDAGFVLDAVPNESLQIFPVISGVWRIGKGYGGRSL